MTFGRTQYGAEAFRLDRVSRKAQGLHTANSPIDTACAHAGQSHHSPNLAPARHPASNSRTQQQHRILAGLVCA